jgi:hypothetical protein
MHPLSSLIETQQREQRRAQQRAETRRYQEESYGEELPRRAPRLTALRRAALALGTTLTRR